MTIEIPAYHSIGHLAARTRARLLALAILVLTSPSIWAATYEAVRIDQGSTQGVLWKKAPDGPARGVVVILPGAQMVAERYMWLTEALVSDGYATVLVEAGSLENPRVVGSIPTPATISNQAVAAGFRQRVRPLMVVGAQAVPTLGDHDARPPKTRSALGARG